MSKNKKPPNGDYEIGYGKPPKDTQFKPGQSGNPKGRPKKKKSENHNIEDLLSETISVSYKGCQKQMTPFEVSLRQLVGRALKKDIRAIKEVIEVFEDYDILKPPPKKHHSGVVIVSPDRSDDKSSWYR